MNTVKHQYLTFTITCMFNIYKCFKTFEIGWTNETFWTLEMLESVQVLHLEGETEYCNHRSDIKDMTTGQTSQHAPGTHVYCKHMTIWGQKVSGVNYYTGCTKLQ